MSTLVSFDKIILAGGGWGSESDLYFWLRLLGLSVTMIQSRLAGSAGGCVGLPVGGTNGGKLR